MKRKVIFITCLSLCLSSFQIISTQPAMAAVCQGPAAYPPDLPGCLDPVVAAEQAAAELAKRKAEEKAEDERTQLRAQAEAAAAELAAQNAAAAAAILRAEAATIQAQTLLAQISLGKLSDAAAAAEEAASRKAEEAEEAAKELANIVIALNNRITAENNAKKALNDAKKKLETENEEISKRIETAQIKALELLKIAEQRKIEFDLAAIKYEEEQNALNRRKAEQEALILTKNLELEANQSLVEKAYKEYLDAGGEPIAALRVSVLELFKSESLTSKIKKEYLLTQLVYSSNLKTQNQEIISYIISDLRKAYDTALGKVEAVKKEISKAEIVASEIKAGLDASEVRKKEKETAWTTAFNLKASADLEADAARQDRENLEQAIRAAETQLLEKEAGRIAALNAKSRKEAEEAALSQAARELRTAASTIKSIASDSANSARLINDASESIQNLVKVSNAAVTAAATSAAAAATAARTAEFAVRARQEADAAAALATRSQSGSSVPSANVSSAEARAAQEAANRARELERQAQEAARLAAEAKAAEEKAAVEKKAAEDAAAAAKAKADEAALDAMAKEEVKRNAARNQIARDKATAKKLIEKIKNSAINTSKTITRSSQSINSAYEQALTEAAKSNKALAKLKAQEKVALANLNLAKNELLALSKVVDKAALEQKQAIAEYGSAQYKVIQLEIIITSTENLLVNIEKEIKSSERFYNELQSKFEYLNKTAQTAVAKAVASKKIADSAYQALMAASNSSSLVAGDLQNYLETKAEDWVPTTNATTALSKLQEQYQNAQSQANKDKASADRALKELQSVREATLKAKQTLDEKIEQRNKLKIDLTSLNSSLKTAKDDLAAATSIKVKAVSAYTSAANNLAQKTNKFRENEINYQSAKSETKYEFENANSRNNQVVALKKLSEWSKNSIATAKEIMNSIDEEVKNLDSSQALDLINSDVKVGFISTSIPIIIFTTAALITLYAILQRRRRKSKIVEIDPNLLDLMRKRAVLEASQAKTNKTKTKKKSR